MRTTGVRKGKGSGSDAESGLGQQRTTLPRRVAATMSPARVLSLRLPRGLLTLTALLTATCVNSAHLMDEQILGVKQILENPSDKNVTFPITNVETVNSSRVTVGQQNSMIDSVQAQPETEEDLVLEMEELFKTMQLLGFDFDRNATNSTSVSARMKMSDFMFNPLMLVPQLITWGFAPIILANLKMFVMQALMLNKMALNAAIFMTLRNIVFGPRPGPVVKYENYGYKHHHHPPPSTGLYHHHHHRRS